MVHLIASGIQEDNKPRRGTGVGKEMIGAIIILGPMIIALILALA